MLAPTCKCLLLYVEFVTVYVNIWNSISSPTSTTVKVAYAQTETIQAKLSCQKCE